MRLVRIALYIDKFRPMSEERRRQLIEEVTASIVEETGGPEPTRFVYSSGPPSLLHADFIYFAYCYDRAFESLWDACRDETLRRGHSNLLYPLLFVCRQSIELWLKAALSAFSPDGPLPTGHDLRRLWQDLVAALNEGGQPADDDFTASVDRLLNTLDLHDARGDRFRYPTSLDASAYPESDADLEGLYSAHYKITTYCDAVHTMVEEYANALYETAR